MDKISLYREARVFNAIMEVFNFTELEGTGVILSVKLLYQGEVRTLGHLEPY